MTNGKRPGRTVSIYLLLQHFPPGPLALADGAASGAAGPQTSGPSLACVVGRSTRHGRNSALLRTSLPVQQRHGGRPEGHGSKAYGGGMQLLVGRPTVGHDYRSEGCPLRAHATCGDRSSLRMPGVVDSGVRRGGRSVEMFVPHNLLGADGHRAVKRCLNHSGTRLLNYFVTATTPTQATHTHTHIIIIILINRYLHSHILFVLLFIYIYIYTYTYTYVHV
jgi:hypothetical protein